MYPSYNSRTFADFCTGDETWVHFFEPRRKINNKIWAGKQARRPCIARRLQSVKKIMYAIFYSPQGVVASVPINQGKTVTGRYYKSKILSKVEKYYKKRRPASGKRHICLLHDNAPPHRAQVVAKFLDERKVKVLPHPPYSPDLSPCDFFLFQKLKKFLSGRRYRSRQAVGSAVYQFLKSVPKKDYENSFKSWIKRLKICIQVKGEYFEGQH